MDLMRGCLGFCGYRLQLPPAPYIEGRVSGDRTRLRLFPSRYLLLAAQAKIFPSGLLLVLGVMLMGFPYRASSRSTPYWAAPYRFTVGRLSGTPTSEPFISNKGELGIWRTRVYRRWRGRHCQKALPRTRFPLSGNSLRCRKSLPA